jgi:hypothetical protein
VTPVPRILTPILALSLGVCASLLFACGGGSKGLIPSGDAASINGSLSQVKQLIADGSCQEAAQAAAKVQERVRALPTSVDTRLRTRLREGAQQLVDRAATDCQAGQTTTETVPTQTTSVPADTTTTDTTTTDTTTTDTTTTDTTTTDTTTQPPPTDTGTGGASPDGTGTVTP